MIYIDTSALVKLVQVEDETPALLDFFAEHPRQVTSALSEVELMRAAHRVSDAHVVQARTVLDRISTITLSPSVLRAAAHVLPGSHLRTLDAIHLAAASAIPDLTFICTYDHRMAESARALGLRTVAPQ
jgi:uncharacterized protein